MDIKIIKTPNHGEEKKNTYMHTHTHTHTQVEKSGKRRINWTSMRDKVWNNSLDTERREAEGRGQGRFEERQNMLIIWVVSE